jgi:hypothetical protein
VPLGLPLKSGTFGHYRPARYFAEDAGRLWATMSDVSKNRFEDAFKRLNALLK